MWCVVRIGALCACVLCCFSNQIQEAKELLLDIARKTVLMQELICTLQ